LTLKFALFGMLHFSIRAENGCGPLMRLRHPSRSTDPTSYSSQSLH